MKPKSFMFIAGEASGDLLAGELVEELRRQLAAEAPLFTPDAQPLETSLEARFFGAGGPRMEAVGVDLAVDMTAHSVVGLSDVVKKSLAFWRVFRQLKGLALARQPEVVICVDFSGFNRRFGHAIRRAAGSRGDWFHNWAPLLVQYVSPQVWASREGRAYRMARDFDLLLSIFPFEKGWYGARVPAFKVEFIGHPIMDRYANAVRESVEPAKRRLLFLPGSRAAELARHLPPMMGAWETIRARMPDLQAQVVLPTEALAVQARACGLSSQIELQVGGLPEALASARLAIASTGTVTMECAYFGVPTVALYKTSWSTYHIAKRLVTVKYLAMPNLLAGGEIFPEFIQDAATAGNLAKAALALLNDEPRRQEIKARLKAIIDSLGGPGANRRAAEAVLRMLRAR